MNFSKIIITLVTVFSVIKSESNASVTCFFMSNGKCSVECDGIKKHFNNIEELSNNINNITGEYFTVNYIKSIDEINTILFHNFSNTSNSNYKLLIQGGLDFNPCIALNYENNQVDVPNINLNNITVLQIYSKLYKYPRTFKINDQYLDKVLFESKPIKEFYYSKYTSTCKIV